MLSLFQTSLLSGQRGSGKTTLMTEISNLIDKDKKWLVINLRNYLSLHKLFYGLIISIIATVITFLILYLVASFNKNNINRKKFRNYCLITFVLVFDCTSLMDNFWGSNTSFIYNSQANYKWNATSVIQKMNQIAIIEHPQKW